MGGVRGWVAGVAAGLALVACRQRAEAVQEAGALREIVRQTMPSVEVAAGLKFKRSPAVQVRSREQVRSYILGKLDEELPPAELASTEAAYKHFGLLPDSVDLRRLMVNVLAEQVAGYYDPDSGALFIPSDADTSKLRAIVVPHELVHALQDQYLPLDSVLHQRHQSDRKSAGEAIFEGQATLVQIRVLMPEQNLDALPDFWDARNAVQMQQDQFPNFSKAPLWVRESLIFPYLAGADFVRWFWKEHPGEQPYGALMPISTSQILHPERYAAHETPVYLAFTRAPGDSLRLEDDLGEFESRLLLQQLTGVEAEAEVLAAGWAGDRYAVFGAHSEALVWYSVWRDPRAAAGYLSALKRGWAKRSEPGRVTHIEAMSIDGKPGLRVVDAPSGWAGWRHMPQVRTVPAPK